MSDPPVGHATDEELVRRAQQNPSDPVGRAAASELFGRYQERVYLWCFRRVHDHERALDVAQDVLLSAYRSLASFEGRARYSSWLFAIARNRCYRVLRPASLQRDEEAEPDDLPGEHKGPDALLEEREDEEAILEMVKQVLEPREQLAVWLRCFENLPVEEITRRLDIAVPTGARGVLQSARKKLRAALERRRAREGWRSS